MTTAIFRFFFYFIT
ncbi:MAG: pheST operon leader peptide PheM [Symbiopectobacterium sp.]